MKKISTLLAGFLLSIFFSTSISAQDYAMQAPIGYGAGTTGGAGGKVTTVRTEAEFKAAITANGAGIILVDGTITVNKQMTGKISNKTIIGLPGATLASNNQTKDGSGIWEISEGSTNIIVRNLKFQGPGAYDTDGKDNLFNRGTKVWVDHCEFDSGVDGNFDNSNGADNVTISWCKFVYTKPNKSGGPGGTDNHSFSNLVGGDEDVYPADGRYNITFMNCWWGQGVIERMPRARNATLHLLNNYVSAGDLAIGLSAGDKGTDCYAENCVFEGVKTVQKTNYGGAPKLTIVGCDKGNTVVNNGVAKPTYSYTALPLAQVKAAVSGICGAGATLQVAVNGQTVTVSSSCNATEPTISLASAPATASQTVTQGTAMQELSYVYGGTATGFEVTYNGSPTKPSWLTYNNGKFTGTPAGYTASTTLTIKIKAIGGGASSAEMTATIAINVPLPLLTDPVASYTMSGTTANVSWGAVANASSYNVKVCTAGGGGSSKNITFNDATVETITGDKNLAVGVDVIGSTKAKIAARAGTYGGVAITKYLDFGGGGSTTSNALKIACDGVGTLTVYNNAADNGRTINISNGSSVIGSITANNGTVAIPAAGNYYLYSTGSGIQVYVLQFTSSSTCAIANTKGTSYSVENAEGATIYVQAVGDGSSYESSEYTEATMVAGKVDATLTLASGNANQSLKIGEDLTAIVYNYTGTPAIQWTGTSNATTAPDGIYVNISATQIAITGTPSATGSFGYTVSAAGINGGTNATSLKGTITVTLAPVNAVLTLSSESANASVTAGNVVDIAYDYTGATPVVTWTGTANASTAPQEIKVELGPDYINIYGTATVAGTYSYNIQVNGLNGGSNAAAKGGTVTVLPALTVPANIQATPGQTTINLSWDAVAGAEKYIVKLCHDEEVEDTGGGNGITTLMTLADFTETVAGGVTVNIDGSITKTAGATSTRIKTGTKDLRGATLNIVYTLQTAGSQQLKLNFDDNNSSNGRILNLTNTAANSTESIELTGATGTDFLCFRLDGKCGITIHSLTVTKAGEGGGTGGGTIITPVCDETYETETNSITIPNLTPETEYTYQVKAIRGTEETAYSPSASTTTLANAPVKQDPTAPTGLTATYGETLANVELPTGWTWTVATTTSVGNAGTNNFYVNFAGDELYNAANNMLVKIAVSKAAGIFPGLAATPQISYTEGLKLSDVSLPAGYAWVNGNTALNAGNGQAFAATYTDPSGNYETAYGNLTVDVAKATTAFVNISPIQAIYSAVLKLHSLQLPEGYTWKSADQNLNVGNNQSFTVTYTKNSNYEPVDGTVIVNVSEANGSFPAHNQVAAGYTPTLKLADIELNPNYSWKDGTTPLTVANSGQTFTAVYDDPTDGFAVVEGQITVIVNKAPAPAPPTGLIATEGSTLADIEHLLPEDWTWVSPTNSVGSEGDQTHQVHYLGSANHEPADVIVTVTRTTGIDEATAKFSVYQREQTLMVTGSTVNALEVYSIAGATIAANENSDNIDLPAISTGVYLVKINKAVVKKFIWKR
ncbi:MAG: T9SS type A sorting domain-containing protein [Prevotellaceae bacterium]|jgi:pectate lyase|nr:T9SS type A sorting domain-containing protein [Prevotellaceae bacterium]